MHSGAGEWMHAAASPLEGSSRAGLCPGREQRRAVPPQGQRQQIAPDRAPLVPPPLPLAQVVAALRAVGYQVADIPGRLRQQQEAGPGQHGEPPGQVALLPPQQVDALLAEHLPPELLGRLYSFQQDGVRFGLQRCGLAWAVGWAVGCWLGCWLGWAGGVAARQAGAAAAARCAWALCAWLHVHAAGRHHPRRNTAAPS